MCIIKLLSDIHLEHYKEYPGIDYFIPEDQYIDIICLCGDISFPEKESYVKFLADCAKKCNIYTFIIMGNHEAYNKTIDNTSKLIRDICTNINNSFNSDKIIFLNNSTFDVSGYRFIGTTLWSDIDTTYAWLIRSCLSDYRYIKGWSLGECKDSFHKNVAWLRSVLQEAEDDNIKVIIMTHHAPLLSLGNNYYAKSALKSAFESDLLDLIKKNTHLISYWFYGHNHYSESVTIENTTIISNQMGYKDESNTRYNSDMLLII